MQNYDEVEEKLEQMFADGVEKTNGSSTNKTKKAITSQGTNARKKGKSSAALKRKKALAAKLSNDIPTMPIKDDTENSIRYKGPYIQFKNNKTKIINYPNDDVELDKNSIKGRVVQKKSEINPVRGMHASTLSSKYDANNTDETWRCAFCSLGPHKYALGDLLGPILISEPSDNVVKSPRKKLEALKNKKIEVWAHEDCVVSAAGVYIIGTKIVGLENAIMDSKLHICSICQTVGATINCIQRNCHLKAHFICGKKENWHLSDDFRYFCNIHKETTSTQ